MGRAVQEIAVLEYQGPQGNFELALVESSSISRTKSKSRVKTMNRLRRSIAMQTGTEEVTLTLTVIPEVGTQSETNWVKSWKDDEIFTIVAEKGIGGIREQIIDCEVSDVSDTHNENGEARQEVTVEGLLAIEEP